MQAPFIIATTHKVKPEALDGLKTALAQYRQILEANESGSLAWFGYLSEDENELSVLHVLSDADAAEHHLQVAGEMIGEGLGHTDGNIRVELYGTPGELLSQAVQHNESNGTIVSVKEKSLGGFTRSHPRG